MYELLGTNMPTDKEKFIALMTEFGVPLGASSLEATETLSIEDQASPKVTGYPGFFVDFVFDSTTGAFIKVGIWE